MAEENKDLNTEEIIESNEPEVTEVIDANEKEQQHLDSDESKMETLREEVDNLIKEKDELYQKLLRNQAEFDNFKKRTQKEKESDRKYKSQDLVNDLLPAIDNFERALQLEITEENASFVEGITMVYRQLKDALKQQGVEEIETEGKSFDPNLHHAVMQIEDEEMESNIIVEELQKGYILKDRVIRPAMVKVNK
ncbi:nucleotide exchange factor GrpE [Virgibacillus ndiopensis]|uniref:nucleotide exchange factor GrpE n=1 Tax=Virgibacillus ndiopensis TaxID=2004408 RepID=UPI000C084E40|nr:nucleotide exchange factor GrpE [Virgibacillus ndiopensis]